MLERRYGGAEQQCTRYPWQSREILGGREPTNAGQGGGTATGYDFWGRAVGAPTMRLRLVDEARGLPNHDGMRSFLSEDVELARAHFGRRDQFQAEGGLSTIKCSAMVDVATVGISIFTLC